MRALKWVAFFSVMILMLNACGGSGDDDDSASTDTDDDSTTDDDVDDDSDDDTGDDDTWPPLPDDDTDDDTGDDDQPPLPDPTYGWILLDSDRTHITEVLNKAADFGIDNVQLSHDIIMDIDEINESEAKAELVQDVAQEAHGLGLTVWVWAHEFAREGYFQCLDPDDDLWQRRATAYRTALERVPEIDGVVLMFGSAETEPWYVVCWCDWCKELPPTGNPVLDFLHARPAERLQQIYGTVGGVVMDEFGKGLRIRTFMHEPLEIKWLRDSLKGYDNPYLAVMSKDVPQDWQPYYPDNPLIGDVGHRHQIIEMDLGNEYWGQSDILNGQVDYIARRWSYDRDHGARGAAARIERGSNHAFGTPNEINLYAYTRLVIDGAEPDDVYREWFDTRYGFAPVSTESNVLKHIFRTSHDAMRKMYYTLGMWTLEKGSDVTTNATFPEQLVARNTAYYDPDWWEVSETLAFPDEQTLRDLWQEGTEAVEIADDNVAALELIEGSFTDSADYDQLHDLLALHADCTRVWRHVKDAMFRYMYSRSGHADAIDTIEWDLEQLADFADAMEATWGAGVSPGNPGRIREFISDLRGEVPDQVDETPYVPITLSDIEAQDDGNGEWTITWHSSTATTGFVQWTDKLPLYADTSGETESFGTSHSITIDVGVEGGIHYIRAGGHDVSATLIRSADTMIGLD